MKSNLLQHRQGTKRTSPQHSHIGVPSAAGAFTAGCVLRHRG